MFFNSFFFLLEPQYNIMSRHLQNWVGQVTANEQIFNPALFTPMKAL